MERRRSARLMSANGRTFLKRLACFRVPLSQPFREVTFCASYKCHCLGSCGSRLSWLWGEGVPSRVARGAPNSAAAARDDLAPAYPTLNM